MQTLFRKRIVTTCKMSLNSKTFNTRVLRVDPSSIVFPSNADLPLINDEESKANLEEAAHELKTTNNAVAFPTETVYGLGALALCDDLVQLIYRAKNRPADNPLIVHVSLVAQLSRRLLPPHYKIPEIYQPLIDAFWPGPLTILLPVLAGLPVSSLVTASQTTFAVRLPQHPVARALIALCDLPLAAPSANALTRPSPTRAQHVLFDLNGRIPIILDGGSSDVGLESTVVDGLVSPPQLLRPGGILPEQIRHVGGKAWENMIVAAPLVSSAEAVRTPGMKYRHYLPTAPVILFTQCGDGIERIQRYLSNHEYTPIITRFKNKEHKEEEEIRIGLLRGQFFAEGERISPLISIEREMGSTGELISRSLFHCLREVDESGVDLILVEGMDTAGEGLAVMNRLQKAAAATVC